jgi:hypothetical protein
MMLLLGCGFETSGVVSEGPGQVLLSLVNPDLNIQFWLGLQLGYAPLNSAVVHRGYAEE